MRKEAIYRLKLGEAVRQSAIVLHSTTASSTKPVVYLSCVTEGKTPLLEVKIQEPQGAPLHTLYPTSD